VRTNVATRIADVAALARVSPATVSRVLNGAVTVDPILRARVEDAVALLDYRPDRIARSLRRGAAATIGVILSDIQNPFFTALVRGVEQVAGQAGRLVMLCNSDGDPSRERRYGEALLAERVAGVVIASADPAGGTVGALTRAGMPVVVVDRRSGNAAVDAVFVDNRAGAMAAVEHLVGLGHRRLGVISGPLEFSVAAERHAGFLAALDARGLEHDPALARVGDFRQTSGFAAMQSLLECDRGLQAVFVASDLMTLGALAAIHEAGLAIPGDVSVVGFDDMPWAASLNPPLTTVAQPAVEMGVVAARVLLDRLDDAADIAPRRIVLQPRLVVRASTAPPPRIRGVQ
jgi:LacI family transcriptional regulator